MAKVDKIGYCDPDKNLDISTLICWDTIPK